MIKLFLSAVAGCLILSSSMAQDKPAHDQEKVIHDNNAQVRTVSNFHAIHVSTGIHLYLTQGDEEAVAVSASQLSYRDRIRTEVENGVLKIYFDFKDWSHWHTSGKELKAYVSCKMLDALRASSGAMVEIDGSVHSEMLSLNFSSGASFSGKVQVTKLEVDQSSGALSTISGSAVSLKAVATSGGIFHGGDLQANECEARANSGGVMDINVLKTLTASAHSGGIVNYEGTGVMTSINTGSGGVVSRK
ncbi:MAG: DUF2807 domain-containing protein [Puia sp.]|nr:DUF2807 domain-containing protein [Puia sp.]